MAKIFISYRRDDSGYIALMLRDKLEERFGRQSVYLDIDNIPFGIDFRDHIDSAVSQCDVMLAVIGSAWAGANLADGTRRIDSPTDVVRVEIESGLNRGIPVIPLLIDKADMPAVAELPETLHGLAYRNAAEFRAGRDSKNQLQLLMDGIDSLLKVKPKPGRVKPTPAVTKSAAPSRLGPALDRVRTSGRSIPAALGRWFASLRSRPPQPAWPSTLWIQSRKPLVFLVVLWGLAYLVGMVGFLMNNIDLPFIHLRSGPVGGLAIAFVTSAVLIFLVKRDSHWTAWLLYEIQVIGLWTCFTLGFLNSDTSDRSPANFAGVTFAWCLGGCLAFPILRGAQLWWQSLRERRLP